MWPTRPSRTSFILLNVAAYLTLVTVAIPTLAGVPAQSRWWVGGLLALFGVLVLVFQRGPRGGVMPHVHLFLKAAIVAFLMVRFPHVGLAQVHLLFFVLSAYATLILPLNVALVWIIAFFLFTVGVAWQIGGLAHAVGLSPVAGGHALFGGFGALLRRSEEDRRKTEALLQELREAHGQLQAYAAQAEELAVAEERNRLAREMHDALGHRLTVAVVQLEGAQRLIPTEPERAASMVGAMREELKAALGDLRRTVAALRSAPETDLPLVEALGRLAHSFEGATGIHVSLALPQEMPTLPDAYRLAIYRAAQEGLTNVQRHAVAENAWLSLQIGDGNVTLNVDDDGLGVAAAAEQALRGLRERAARLQGDVILLSNGPEGGARLTMWLPWPETEVAQG